MKWEVSKCHMKYEDSKYRKIEILQAALWNSNILQIASNAFNVRFSISGDLDAQHK